MSLEDIEKELYAKETDITEKRKLREPVQKNLPPVTEYWQKRPEKPYEPPIDIGPQVEKIFIKTRSWWKPIMIGGSVLFAVAILVSGYFIYQSLTARGINMDVTAPGQALIGEPFTFAVDINNNSGNGLSNAKLSLHLPPGVVIAGKTKDVVVETHDIGNFDSGALKKDSFQLIVLDGENSVKRITATLSYNTASIGAPFEKSTDIDIAVRGSAIAIDLLSPNKVFSSENFELTLSYKNISDTNFDKVTIAAAYPPTFTFQSASLPPTSGNNTWEITNLKKGDSGKIAIQGNMLGQDQSFFDTAFTVTESIAGQDYQIANKSTSLGISSSPLALSIQIENGDNATAHPGDLLTYTIQYTNNTQVGLQDVVLKLKLTGEMFDFSSPSTNGFVTSLDRTVTWNAANNTDFHLLQPGAQGSVQFTIRVRTAFPIQKINDKNFSLKVDGQIESPTVPNLVGAEHTIGIASLETKIIGNTTVAAQGFLNDPSGITNTGTWPPKVDQPQQYTIHWIIKNYATDVTNVRINAFLQAGVRWTGNVKSNIDAAPQYNDRTQEVTWQIPKIAATKGVIDTPLEAVFQIEATPSLNFVNQYMPLMGPTTLHAQDMFTNTDISTTDVGVTTNLSANDPTAAGGSVQQ